jgi:nucleotide-binding universal stress UspA family protein
MTMTSAAPSSGTLHLVVGYDGSPPAVRALDAAVRLLSGRTGKIEVLYVGHLSAADSMSPDALAEMEQTFSDIARDLRAEVAEHLQGQEDRWQFEWRQGEIARELTAEADRLGEAEPGTTVVIVVGSSSHAAHRVIGSVAVSLSRHAPVPLVIVP